MTGHDELAQVYWRLLMQELPSSGQMRDVGEAGRRAAHRVNAVRNLFFSILDVGDARILLEIGAHDAASSLRFTSTAPEVRYAHAYEASPRLYDHLKAEFEDRPGITIHPEAVGDHVGTSTFYIPRESRLDVWGSTTRRSDLGDVEVLQVDMVTLDIAAERAGAGRLGRDTALWVDVEGAEFSVLQGGRSALATKVAAAYIEVSDNPVHDLGATSLQVIELMLDMGFVPVARDSQFTRAFNALFCHRALMGVASPVISRFLLGQRRRAGHVGGMGTSAVTPQVRVAGALDDSNPDIECVTLGCLRPRSPLSARAL